jgi:uncharacterized protein (TIGR03118 family)
MNRFIRSVAPDGIAAIAVAAVMAVCAGDAAATSPNAYLVTVLTSNQASTKAAFTDPHLQNAWGVAFSPAGSPFWISDNNSGLSTLYNGAGEPYPPKTTTTSPLVVTIPCPASAGEGSSCPKGPAGPTGMVWNPTTNPATAFLVPKTALPASFIWATEDGTIAAWTGGLTPPDDAVIAVDNSVTPSKKLGAVYKGLAVAVNCTGVACAVNNGPLLFATNFRAGTIEAYAPAPADSTTGFYVRVTTDGGFVDKNIPAGFAPFGIQYIDGNLIVTYAKQDPSKHDNLPGGGYVDAFDTDGHLLERLASNGFLGAPWGVARASFAFGLFSGDLLIGNFGNGWVVALTPTKQVLLTAKNGNPVFIDGLWNLGLGGGKASNPATLYFTSGPNNETNGRFGTITPDPSTTTTGGGTGGGGWN